MLWYLATPYTKHPDGTDAAYREACRNHALLVQHGVDVFCPISHAHGVAEHVTGNHDFWMRVDRPFIRLCDGLIMLMMPSWKQSRGMSEEYAEFSSVGKRVIYMEPGIVPDEFLHKD